MLGFLPRGKFMTAEIDYGHLMHQAMRGLIRKVLDGVAQGGLPGAHHFFITFDTHHPDVELADWLRERYPDEMTVVMQHWFENLVVEEDGFAITLNFGERPEPMYIPYDSVLTFVDPSVEFGLRFEAPEDEEDDGDVTLAPMPDHFTETDDDDAPDEPPKAGEVVSLDSFRKN
jgi:hypothetical protein